MLNKKMMDKPVLFPFKDFHKNLYSKWRDIQTQKDFYDVTLASEYGQISAHKVIVSSCSPVLGKLLKDHPHHHPLIFLRGVNFSNLVSVIDFMYQGKVKIPQKNLPEFQTLLKELKIGGDYDKEDHFEIEQNNCLIQNQNDMKEKEYTVEEQETFVIKDEDGDQVIRKEESENYVSRENKVVLFENNPVVVKDTKVDNVNKDEDPESNTVYSIDVQNDKFEENVFENSTSVVKQEEGYPCPNCTTRVATKQTLNRHIQRIHNKKSQSQFSCTICGFQSTYIVTIQRHERSVHSDEKPFKCNICTKGYKKYDSLQVHVQSVHGSKRFPCETCGKEFKCKEYLRFHERSHNSDKLFYCAICGNGFVTNVKLKEHTNTHTGEKPFPCIYPNCDKSFPSSSSLSHHKRTCSV